MKRPKISDHEVRDYRGDVVGLNMPHYYQALERYCDEIEKWRDEVNRVLNNLGKGDYVRLQKQNEELRRIVDQLPSDIVEEIKQG